MGKLSELWKCEKCGQETVSETKMPPDWTTFVIGWGERSYFAYGSALSEREVTYTICGECAAKVGLAVAQPAPKQMQSTAEQLYDLVVAIAQEATEQ